MMDRILVNCEKVVNVTEGGIVIPESANKEKSVIGKVVAVGEGRYEKDGITRVEMSVKVGDKIMFVKNCGTDVKIEGKDYVMLHEHDVMGIINNPTF